MHNGATPSDLISLENYSRQRCISDMVNEIITRLYGQQFSSYQVIRILHDEFEISHYKGLSDTVRKHLYEVEKAGTITLIRQGRGRGTMNVYQESKYFKAGDTSPVQPDMPPEKNGTPSQASQSEIGEA